MALKRPQIGTGGPTGCSVSAEGGSWSKSLGSLVEFLSSSSYDDGSPRKPGTVMVMWEDGAWKAWLHEREMSATAFLSASTPDGLLKVVNDALAADRVPWRPDRRPQGKPNGRQ